MTGYEARRSETKATRFAGLFRYRIIVTYEAEAQGVTMDEIIKKVFNAVPVT